MKERKTKQKEMLYQYIFMHRQDIVIVKDMLEMFKNQISQATIYRFISALEAKGELVKCEGEGIYRFVSDECLEHNHIHLMCQSCHRLYHIDQSELAPFLSKLSNQYGFYIDQQTTLLGQCLSCSEKEIVK